MIYVGNNKCPKCDNDLRYYDKVKRLVKSGNGNSYEILLRRLKCQQCRKIHREIPSIILPYKQYESEIITGVCEGFITPDMIGFEDYPCEMTMLRWKSQNLHTSL